MLSAASYPGQVALIDEMGVHERLKQYFYTFSDDNYMHFLCEPFAE